MTAYSIIASCNYESADDPMDRTIHEIRKAIDAGLTDDAELLAAMATLEDVLIDHADSDTVVSVDACCDAEAVVLSAWTEEVRQCVGTARAERYSS